MKSQRQQQKESTRRIIIEAALEQFAKDGLVAARTSDIAAAAKVSHGSIFAHFPTRENLVDAVIEDFGMRVTSRLHELVNETCNIKEVFEAHLMGLREHEKFYTRLVSEAKLLSESSRNSLIMIQSAISFHISQISQREMEAGTIRKMPVDLLFNTWIGLVHHYLMNDDLFAPEGSVLEKYSNQLVEHYYNLISK